jgi:hypothetical protein
MDAYLTSKSVFLPSFRAPVGQAAAQTAGQTAGQTAERTAGRLDKQA